MNFEEILPGLRAGNTYRRAPWRPGLALLVVGDHVAMSDDPDHRYISSTDLLADDWVLLESKPRCDGGTWGLHHTFCREPIHATCTCKRCLSESPGERFYACANHLDNVATKHERVRGRPPVWHTETKA